MKIKNVPKSKNVEEAQTSTAIYYTENRRYQEVTKKSPESPWSNYIRKEISRNFQDKVKGKTDRYTRKNALDEFNKNR